MKTWVKLLIGISVTVITAAIIIYFFMYNKPHPDYANLDVEFSMQAAALFDEFSADGTAAGSKYIGKMVGINGPITRVEQSDSLVTIVFVIRKGEFGDEGLRCSMLPSSAEAARKLQPGADVKIKGYCTGFTGDVVMEECTFYNE